jgi:RNA polymerase sigma-70 factor (ECF subfamily)
LDPRSELIDLLPRLRRFGLRLSGSADVADDLVQAACLRALERWHQWTPGTNLASWCFRIMQTIWLDEGRRRRRSPITPGLDIDRVAATAAGDAPEATDALSKIEAEIARLPEEQRAVLLLAVSEGLSYREIAEIQKVPIGTVMSRLSRARQRLAQAIADVPEGNVR